MTEKEKRAGRKPGFKNPNAGRKAGSKNVKRLNPKLKRDFYNLRMPRYVIEWLREQKGSASKMVTDAVIEKYGIMEPEIPKKVKIDDKIGLTTQKVVKDNKKGVTKYSVTP